MAKLTNITSIIFLISFLISCEEKSKDNTAQAVAAILLGSNPTCSVSGTQYIISSCDSAGFSRIGLSSQNVAVGATGTGTSSRIASNGGIISSNDVSIEITFMLNDASGYVEVIGRGSGAVSSIDGPAIRINQSNIQARGATGGAGLTTLGGSAQSTTVGQTVTYCMDFHQESADLHAIFWPSACSAVSAADRATYARDVEIASGFPGQLVGFILNNATLRSFTVTNKIGTAGNLLQP